MKNIQLIAFDADDTLWINETYFQETEKIFCELHTPTRTRIRSICRSYPVSCNLVA